MSPAWQDVLSSLAPQAICAASDPTQEIRQAQSSAVMAPLTQFGIIDVQGDDARTFLHNQFTSDINHLTSEAVQHSSWCTAKGRMLASFLIWRHGEGYRLALAAELLPAILKRLQMYVLRAKVKLADVSQEVLLLGLAGPEAEASLNKAGLTPSTAPLSLAQTTAGPLACLETQRFILAVAADQLASIWPKLATTATPAGLTTWHWLDIAAGLPVITAATQEEFVPQMVDFEKIGGVSFHKGCYPGQEIVARTQYLGKIKRHLYRISSPVALQAGDDLFSPGNPDQTCGKVVSAAPAPEGGFVALAVIQSNHAEDVHLESREGPQLSAVALYPV